MKNMLMNCDSVQDPHVCHSRNEIEQRMKLCRVSAETLHKAPEMHHTKAREGTDTMAISRQLVVRHMLVFFITDMVVQNLPVQHPVAI